MNNIYDVIIIWSWAAWLYTAIAAPFWHKKIILEKTKKFWTKVLLSGWERANVSNMDIEPTRDYFGLNTKSMISILARYNQWDIMSFFAENWVNIVEEDRWRLILESWDSKELLDVLVKKAKDNNTHMKINSEVVSIDKEKDVFCVNILWWKSIYTKNVVVASWWKSFYQVWTTWDWYNFAEHFWINIVTPHRGLCWLTTREDLSGLSWSSSSVSLELLDWEKIIYTETWPLLFTHFWISWPIVFNTAVVLWEYVNKNKITNHEEYFKSNIYIKISFNLEWLPKKIIKKFELNEEKKEIIINVLDWRSWKEAKVTWGWINMNELTNNMESKKVKWLYFCWEVLDLTWKTWWFNLQQAWSTWYIVGKNL